MNTDPATSQRMSQVKVAHTGPELELRRLLHARGLRFRLQSAVEGLPRRRVDIAFPRVKVAVFVDGCFWHGCPEHAQPPKTNTQFWVQKQRSN